jgi:hypothetical protein
MRAAARIVCLVLAAACLGPPAALGENGKPNRPPTELWQAFPLQQTPTHQVKAAVHTEASRTTAPTPHNQGASSLGPVLQLLALIAAVGTLAAISVMVLRARIAPLGTTFIPPTADRKIWYRAIPGTAGPHRVEAKRLVREPPTEEPPGEAPANESVAAEIVDLPPHEAEAQAPVPAELDLVAPEPKPTPPADDKERPLTRPELTWQRAPQQTPKPIEREVLQRCAIAVWRGNEKSQFFATRGPGEAVAVSTSFRAPGGGSPERTTESEQALASLLKQLQQLGWSVVDEGPQWFDRRLERHPMYDEWR